MLEIIRKGYALEFPLSLKEAFLISPYGALMKRAVVQHTLQCLLQLQVVVPMPEDQLGCGWYSICFAVPKKDSTLHPILDLKQVIRALRVTCFFAWSPCVPLLRQSTRVSFLWC